MVFGAVIERLKAGLTKTRQFLSTDVKELLVGRQIDEETLNRLEETLIASDMGVETSHHLIDNLKTAYRERKLETAAAVYDYLKKGLKDILSRGQTGPITAEMPPTVILVCGVNGTGKTTSIAKLAYWLKSQGRKVLLGASDTFRAAAIEQLTIWSERIGVEIIKHQSGADPAAVVFDAAEAARARNADYLIVDTAGRLHTKTNLMKELSKIRNVLAKKITNAPHETLLVLDATTGQNAVTQAKLFNESVPITGIFLAKLDGTAKGGIVIAIKHELNIPVKFIGIGERPEDIEPFEPDRFVEALFDPVRNE